MRSTVAYNYAYTFQVAVPNDGPAASPILPNHYPYPWREDGTGDSGVALRCSAASTGIERCPFRSSYFRHDLPFFQQLAAVAGSEQQRAS